MATDHIVRLDAEADRLDVALQHLIESDRLSRAEADAVRTEFSGLGTEPTRPAWTAVLPEIGGYVGGAFVLAAGVVLAAPRWDQWSRAGQIALLVFAAVVFIGAAVATALSTPGGWSPHRRAGLGVRRRLLAVLFVLGGAAAVGAAALIGGPETGQEYAYGYGYGYVPNPGQLTAATTAVVLALAGYRLCRTPLLHLAALGSLAVAAEVWLDWAVKMIMWPGGSQQIDFATVVRIEYATVVAQSVALALIAVGWAVLATREVLDERHLGLTSAGILFFVGAENCAGYDGRPVTNAVGYLMVALLAAAGLVGYLRTRYVGVLAVGVVALATVVPQAIIHYTDGALGAAGALLIVGVSIVGASILGLRLRSSESPGASPGTAGGGVRNGPGSAGDGSEPSP